MRRKTRETELGVEEGVDEGLEEDEDDVVEDDSDMVVLGGVELDSLGADVGVNDGVNDELWGLLQ